MDNTALSHKILQGTDIMTSAIDIYVRYTLMHV